MLNDPISRPGGSTTINEFCALERTSRTQLYKLWAEGRGPGFYYNGNRRRIPDEERVAWRQRMQASAESAAK
jgi:hypothetical protein